MTLLELFKSVTDGGQEWLRDQAIEAYADTLRNLHPKTSEDDFLEIVGRLAQLLGWKILHIRASVRANGGYRTAVQFDGEGFPDLLMLNTRLRREVVAELKVKKNKLTDKQNEWLDAFTICGRASYSWWPKDHEEIEAVLRNGTDFTEAESWQLAG